jgi:UPF0755 protein
MQHLFKLLIAIGLTVSAMAVGGWLYLSDWAKTPGPLAGELVLEFKPGTRLKDLAAQLKSDNIISDPDRFVMWVRVQRSYDRFQAGNYKLTPMVTPDEVIEKLIRGESFEPVVLTYTVPEGFTVRQVMERLAANGVGHIVANQNLAKDQIFIDNLKIPGSSLEGFIFPATYSFTKIPTPHEAVRHMVETFWQKLPPGYEDRVRQLGLTLYEAITFASLIELETKHDDEKSLISEVIWRRLKDKAPLAIDAALIYGIQDYNGDIKTVHLKDASNPYNTRIHRGLPPTPIGAPGIRAIEAVLTPSAFNYYYYVLKPGDTRHHFSRSLKEHNTNVKKYVEWSKRINKR